ncbi:S-layer homology domain-containing protein [Brevibacillus massiliensis]|uniref:S-layer homology domain-containing protein n=1 Tax=Brevibacillus massiliensis TaxID=1118054 RepID=UPI0002DADBCD|nr:S-layer homology domain-containing protein [Brevibacillus massiliensis]
MRKLALFFLAGLLLFAMMPFAQAQAATKTFKDVPRSHWAYEAISAMAEKGIIQGYTDGTFRPNNKITRAEFAKIMIAAADIEINRSNSIKQTFKDVDRNHWAFYYVELAKNYLTGYKTGTTYLYKPDEYAVREDIAVALVRLMGYDQSKKADLSILSRFRDYSKISPNLQPFIAIAVQTDLIKGFDDRTFRPQDPITRAEAASLLYRAGLDETKVVFPPDDSTKPKPEDPKRPISISDSFSGKNLDNWLTKDATGNWGVIGNRATAVSNDSNLYHYFLPLKWNESANPENYELQIDVIADGTDGLGGLFFNGKDGEADVVTIGKKAITVSHVKDAKNKSTTTLATFAYKLQTTNKLKITVNKDSYEISVNGSFVFGQQDYPIDGTSLGLYLHKDATKDVPDKMTYFDNFQFKEITK